MPSTDVSPVEDLSEFRNDLLPRRLQTAWAVSDQTWHDKDEHDLRAAVYDQAGQTLFSLFTKMRLNFWYQYDKAVACGRMIQPIALTRGICTIDQYYKYIKKYPPLIAWMFCPLISAKLQLKEFEYMADRRMREILSISCVNASGYCDAKLAKVQLDLYCVIQTRLYGAVAQKYENTNKNLNVNVEANKNNAQELASQAITMITDADELNRRLKNVQERREALSAIAAPIEINQEKLMRPDRVGTNQDE